MNLKMGSQIFRNVQIPLLWGKRAIVEDSENKLSIISLEGKEAKVEILADTPAPMIEYEIIEDGFKILSEGKGLYIFSPKRRTITGVCLKLPECEISDGGIRIGSNSFSHNTVMGEGVGIVVDEMGGVGLGGPIPANLAVLSI